MKKLFILALLFTSFISFSQETEEIEKVKQHELKINAFNLIVFKSLDFSYEYLIDSESSAGVSVLFNLIDPHSQDSNEDVFLNETFAITPYYRRYFSNRHAAGFFLEAFGMYNTQKTIRDDYYYTEEHNYVNNDRVESSSNFAFGLNAGGKFVTKKGFLFEIFGGVGRNIIKSNKEAATEFVPRLGATLGWRF